MIPIKDETRLIDLTIGELKSALSNIIRDTMSGCDVKDKEQDYVYGLKGICQLFGCSKNTAAKLKDGILKKAVYQDGRRILTDPVMARKLFNNYYSKKN